MAGKAGAAFVTIEKAATELGVSVEQMLAWNMVVIHDIGGIEVVVGWSTDPLVARYLPTLSQVFQGEALSMCLRNIRPFGDDRDGLAALREGHWQLVLTCLQALRRKFDRIMQDADPLGAAEREAAQEPAASVRLH